MRVFPSVVSRRGVLGIVAVLSLALLPAACGAPGGRNAGTAPKTAKMREAAAVAGVTPLAPPLQVRLIYRPAPPRTLTLSTQWGLVSELSKGTPPLVRRVRAKLQVRAIPRGLEVIVKRQPTVLSRAKDSRKANDAGLLRAAIAPNGRLFEIKTKLDGFDTALVQQRRDHLLHDLVYLGHPAPFHRLLYPAGPGDVDGRRQDRDERNARARAEIALSPLVAIVPGVPPGPVSDGDKVAMLKRDFGTLFRSHPDLWTVTRGHVVGLSHRDGRRVLVVVADKTPAVGPAPGWTLTTRGLGLVDLDTGFYLELHLEHVLTAPASGDAAPTKFIIRERLDLK